MFANRLLAQRTTQNSQYRTRARTQNTQTQRQIVYRHTFLLGHFFLVHYRLETVRMKKVVLFKTSYKWIVDVWGRLAANRMKLTGCWLYSLYRIKYTYMHPYRNTLSVYLFDRMYLKCSMCVWLRVCIFSIPYVCLFIRIFVSLYAPSVLSA